MKWSFFFYGGEEKSIDGREVDSGDFIETFDKDRAFGRVARIGVEEGLNLLKRMSASTSRRAYGDQVAAGHGIEGSFDMSEACNEFRSSPSRFSEATS